VIRNSGQNGGLIRSLPPKWRSLPDSADGEKDKMLVESGGLFFQFQRPEHPGTFGRILLRSVARPAVK
jgi:hypothetical protein